MVMCMDSRGPSWHIQSANCLNMSYVLKIIEFFPSFKAEDVTRGAQADRRADDVELKKCLGRA